MKLILCPGAESEFALDWYQVTPEVGRLIAALKAGQEVMDQTAIAHLPSIRSAIQNLPVFCMHRELEALDPLIRPGDKLIWARDKPEGPERWRIRRYPALDAATHKQAVGFFWEMYKELMSRVAEPVSHLYGMETGVCSEGGTHG